MALNHSLGIQNKAGGIFVVMSLLLGGCQASSALFDLNKPATQNQTRITLHDPSGRDLSGDPGLGDVRLVLQAAIARVRGQSVAQVAKDYGVLNIGSAPTLDLHWTDSTSVSAILLAEYQTGRTRQIEAYMRFADVTGERRDLQINGAFERSGKTIMVQALNMIALIPPELEPDSLLVQAPEVTEETRTTVIEFLAHILATSQPIDTAPASN